MTCFGEVNYVFPKIQKLPWILGLFYQQIVFLRNGVEFKMMFIAASSIQKKLLSGAACTVKSLNIDYYLKNNLIGK